MMTENEIKERCEICLFYKPDDKSKHLLKNLINKNPDDAHIYQNLTGGDPDAGGVGNCSFHKKRVKDTDTCEKFSHDISKNY